MPGLYGKLRYNQLLIADRKGDGSQLQMFGGGATSTGNAAVYDADGNVIDGGVPPGVAPGTLGSVLEKTVAEFDADLDSSPTGFIDGDQILLTDGLYKVYWLNGAPSYYYGTKKIYRPPSTGWSWDNQGVSTIDSNNGYEYLKAVKQSAVECTWRCRTAPSAPYVITASFLIDMTGAITFDGTTANVGVTLLFRESGTGKAVVLRLSTGGVNTTAIQWEKWTSSVSVSTAYSTYGAYAPMVPGIGPQLVHMRIENDNTNLKAYMSIDGLHWHQFGTSQSKTDFMAGGPDQVGWGAYCNASTPVIALISWQES